MKTPLDVLTILYKHLNGSALKPFVSGGIHRNQRPIDSTLEDVVINALPVSGSQVQQASANVNIYVPDLKLKIRGKDQSVPDDVRLDALAAIATTVLRENAGPGYTFWLEKQTIIAEPTIDYHYVNLRVDFTFHNIN